MDQEPLENVPSHSLANALDFILFYKLCPDYG